VQATVTRQVAVVAVDHGQADADVAGEVEGGDAGTECEGGKGMPEIVDPVRAMSHAPWLASRIRCARAVSVRVVRPTCAPRRGEDAPQERPAVARARSRDVRSQHEAGSGGGEGEAVAGEEQGAAHIGSRPPFAVATSVNAAEARSGSQRPISV
jgi:hypothetical protein